MFHHLKIRFAIALSLVVLFALAVFPQTRSARPEQKPPQEKKQTSDEDTALEGDETIRLGTELVNVLFTAIDRNNRVVSNIEQKEVVLTEDGRKQEIFTFKREANLPINIAILMDLSGSQEYTFPQEKMAASEFLRSVIRPGKDSGAILTFRDDAELVQGLTSRTEILGRALDEIDYSRRFGNRSTRNQATALYDSLFITVDEVLGRASSRPQPDDAVTRRAIILLTDGVDNASSHKLEEAIDRAWRSGVMVYSIGIGDRFRFEGVREDILSRISDETGGRAYFPRGPEELLANFRQIEGDLRSQYLIAYSPTNAARDGSFRQIEVSLPGRPDVRIFHRHGYYAPAEDGKK